MPEDFVGFFSDIERQLSDIQAYFASYQEKYFPARSSQFFCLELNGEAGELANAEKKQWKGKDVPSESFSDEAADVFIALTNYCNSKSINLGRAVRDKLIKIESKRKELQGMGLDY